MGNQSDLFLEAVPLGNQLFQEVLELTGLPADSFSQELTRILVSLGTDPQKVTLDELRQATLIYLEETLFKENTLN